MAKEYLCSLTQHRKEPESDKSTETKENSVSLHNVTMTILIRSVLMAIFVIHQLLLIVALQ